ncbi:hypothetical protein AVEN_259398-1 [Araneus ventricosus]|uniref:Uncharacterized protein n=1 Tax=Araneus ventricosus TaxID=182803 RepID=A0A4Y2LNQ9_ARAVE|nr:hypothetical protein AVEN_259398-1 [Araneus ventricosus]
MNQLFVVCGGREKKHCCVHATSAENGQCSPLLMPIDVVVIFLILTVPNAKRYLTLKEAIQRLFEGHTDDDEQSYILLFCQKLQKLVMKKEMIIF